MTNLINYTWMYVMLFMPFLTVQGCGPQQGSDPQNDKPSSFSFSFQDSMPENVLRSYLSRSITMAEVATGPEFYVDSDIPNREDDERMLLNIGAKFIGRSAYLWGQENKAAHPRFFNSIKANITKLQEQDPELIFQACIFEIVTRQVENVSVPARVFHAFGLKPVRRNFQYENMTFPSGDFINHWGEGASVPDVTRMETRLWFYYLATSYIDAGMEALHWGQVQLTGRADAENDFRAWQALLIRVRKYAAHNARRGWVLCDGHTPFGGLVVENRLLLDFHSFPLRIKETPAQNMEGRLEMGYLDGLYGRSKGGVTPSGWVTSSLPYLVEFDNFGISDHPGEAALEDHFVWGYDEITWFSLLPEEKRNVFLSYAFEWIREKDPAGYLQMPGNRKISPGNGVWEKRYRANHQTDQFPYGYSQEEKIKYLWK